MKLSNHALSFLLAQYRAIFKKAYIKGLAPAVLLTAGLAAAGSAQAASLSVKDLPGAGEIFNITGNDAATAPDYYFLQVSGTSSDFNGEININAGYATEGQSGENFIQGVTGTETSITGTGTLNIDIANAQQGQGLLVVGNGSGSTLDIGAINVNSGALKVVSSGSNGSGSVVVAADTITIGDGSSQAWAVLADSGAGTGVTLGRAASKDIVGSTITVNDGGQLLMQGSGASGATILGAELTLNAGAVMLTDTGTNNKVQTDDFTLGSGAFKVISGNSANVGETFAGKQATIASGANFLVGTSGTWTIADGEDAAGDPINPDVTIQAGANVQVDGNIVVSGGLLTIESGAGLFATTPAGTGLSGTITVAEKSTNQGLAIDSSVLEGFLKAGDVYHDIKIDDSGDYITAETATQDKAGSVVLKAGRLTFSDTDQVELSHFGFVSGDGTSGAAGQIVLSGSNVIGGHDISIAKKLTASGDGQGAALTGATLHVSTDYLTLGDGTTSGLTKLSDSGITQLTIRDGLTVKVAKVANDGFFAFDSNAKEKIKFENSDTTSTSQVNGKIEFGASYRNMIKGKWDFNDDIKLSQSTDGNPGLLIGHDITQTSKYDTYVTFKGALINNTANGGYNGIMVSEASNADTVFDLTQATLSSTNGDNAGMIALGASKGAVIKITGNQFDQILNAQKGNGVAESGDGFALSASTATKDGVIEVTSAVTGEYNFKKFQAKPSDQAGSSYENKMTFEDGGILAINGDLGLYTGDKKDSKASGSALNIGAGTIKATQLTLTNYEADDAKAGTYKDVVLKSGTLAVSQALSVNKSDTLQLGEAAGDNANLELKTETLTGTGTLNVAKDVVLNGTGAIKVQQGAWSTQANIYASGSSGLVLENSAIDHDDLAENAYGASFVGKNFKATGTGTAIAAAAGTKATFDTMQLGDSSVISLNDGQLLVNGANITVAEGDKTTDNPAYVNLDANKTSTTAGIDFGKATVNVSGAAAVMEFGATATAGLLTLSGDKFTLDKGGIDEATFDVTDFGQLKFNFAEGTQLSTKQVSSLVTALGVGDKNGTGYINLGNADLGFNWVDHDNGTTSIKWDDIEDYVNVIGSTATIDKLKAAQVTDIAYTDKVKGHYGALSVVTTTNSLAINGPTSLHNAGAFGNKFAVNQNTGDLIGLRLENGASLNLANGGEIGAIEGTFDPDNNVILSNDAGVTGPTTTSVAGGITKVNLLQVGSANEAIVAGNVEAVELDVQGSLSNAAQTDSTIATNNLQVGANATVATNNLTLGRVNGINSATREVLGSVTVGDTLTVQGGDLSLYDGAVSTKDLVLAQSGSVRVGYEPVSTITADDPSTDFDDTKSYSGVFEATGTVELNDGYLFVDPDYGQETALISLNHFKDADTNHRTTIGTMDGSAFVGANSALAVGSESADFLKQKIARFETNGSLSGDPEGVGAVMYVGNSFTLKSGHSIIMTAQSLEDFIDYYNTNDGRASDVFAQGTKAPKLDDTIYLGSNTVVMMDAGALTGAQSTNSKITPVISFGATTAGNIIADGGDILVDGKVRAGTYQLVEVGTKIDYLDGSNYKIVTDSTAAHFEDNINVTTDNEFLKGVLDSNGSVQLSVDRANAYSIMSGASDPVVATLIDYAQGYKVVGEDDQGNEIREELYDGYKYDSTGHVITDSEGKPTKNYDYGNYFLDAAVTAGNGAAAEAAARLGVYGGAPQAALSAGKSSTDAIASRFGIGSALSNLTLAGNTQGATLWLAPVYKSADSDGFEAQGVDYGVDVDLYGVALGADYTLSNGITFGAMFNVGSGDIDGEGAAAAVSNDFDYYGFGIYGGYAVGPFSVIGDISYTVADNELEANTAIDKIGAKMDSSNLSLGVTGKYALEFNGVNITPHAGLRFSNIDLDDYTIDGEDVVAHADSDSLNLFAIPVGVTIDKEFKGESWTVAPSFDLTLTGQFGDDELDGDVSWAGVSNLTTHTTTEVLDNFTYGATLGVEAQSVGGVALGLSVGYTGSSNTDEFGVNANARFTF